MIDVLDDNSEAALEADMIDFVPDPSQLARPQREASGMPPWLIAALATAAVLTAILMLRPGPATAHAAEEMDPSAQTATPGHADLFQLPEWHDDPADAKAAR